VAVVPELAAIFRATRGTPGLDIALASTGALPIP
jgi:hypothetical protein